MAQTGTVTAESVRTSLNEADTSEFPDSVIEQKITEAEVIVQQNTDREVAELDQLAYETAVRETAAYRTFTSAPAEMKRAALDLSATYDVQGYTNRRKERRDEALGLVGASASGGTSAAIVGATDTVLDREPGADDYDDHDYDGWGDVEP